MNCVNNKDIRTMPMAVMDKSRQWNKSLGDRTEENKRKWFKLKKSPYHFHGNQVNL